MLMTAPSLQAKNTVQAKSADDADHLRECRRNTLTMITKKHAHDDGALTVDAENATAPGTPMTLRTPRMTMMGFVVFGHIVLSIDGARW